MPTTPVQPTQSAAGQSLLWFEVVNSLRLATSTELWRMLITRNVPNWFEVCLAWRNLGLTIKRLCPDDVALPRDVIQFDDQLAWVWTPIEPHMDAILEVLDERITISSAMLIPTFDILRSSALLFPDGTLSPLIEQAMQAETVRDSVATNELYRKMRDMSASTAHTKVKAYKEIGVTLTRTELEASMQ